MCTLPIRVVSLVKGSTIFIELVRIYQLPVIVSIESCPRHDILRSIGVYQSSKPGNIGNLTSRIDTAQVVCTFGTQRRFRQVGDYRVSSEKGNRSNSQNDKTAYIGKSSSREDVPSALKNQPFTLINVHFYHYLVITGARSM